MIFSETYSESYDQIHSLKEYEKECENLRDFIHHQIKTSSNRKILDFGCGTGTHLAFLQGLNFELFGYDINENMLKIARIKAPALDFASKLRNLPNNFDLIYSLFDVINYQATDYDLKIYFMQIASKLKPHGIIGLDGWHLTGVKKSSPTISERLFHSTKGLIMRRVVPSKMTSENVFHLKITLENQESKSLLCEEIHQIKVYSTDQIKTIARESGFVDIEFRDGQNWETNLKDTSWKFFMKARKQ